jgi:hypothetical protein
LSSDPLGQVGVEPLFRRLDPGSGLDLAHLEPELRRCLSPGREPAAEDDAFRAVLNTNRILDQEARTGLRGVLAASSALVLAGAGMEA